MPTKNRPDEPIHMPSNWHILSEGQIPELLSRAHAAYHPDKDRWVKETTALMGGARFLAHHNGDYILLTEYLRLDEHSLYAMSLKDSVDWLAYETLWLHSKKDMPPQRGEQWRQLVCESLQDLVLKEMKKVVRQSAAQAWESYWKECQRLDSSADKNPDGPTP